MNPSRWGLAEWVCAAMIGLGVAGVVALMHFAITHDCVRSHKQPAVQTVCIGNPPICNSSVYEQTVCDEWTEAK